jgi:hypothetical protein
MSDSIQHDGAPAAHSAHDHHQMPTSGSALTVILGVRGGPLPRIVGAVAGLAQEAGHLQRLPSAPGRIRTCDLRIRSPLLYPAELPGLGG